MPLKVRLWSLVEEPLKLLPLAFVLALIPVRKLKSLFYLGIASGLGFQMIEDIGSFVRICQRGL